MFFSKKKDAEDEKEKQKKSSSHLSKLKKWDEERRKKFPSHHRVDGEKQYLHCDTKCSAVWRKLQQCIVTEHDFQLVPQPIDLRL